MTDRELRVAALDLAVTLCTEEAKWLMPATGARGYADTITDVADTFVTFLMKEDLKDD